MQTLKSREEINDSKNLNDFQTFSIINPQLYPRSAKEDDKIQGVTYADPYNGDERDRVVGPLCALGFDGNNCDLTKPGASGYINPELLEGGHIAPPKTSSTSMSSTASSSTKTPTSNSGPCTAFESRFESWC